MNRFLTRARSTIGATLAALLLASMLPAYAAAGLEAPEPLRFNIILGASCVRGSGEAGATVQVLWKSGNGLLKAHTSRVIANDNTWEVCRSAMRTEAFDTLWVSDGSSSNAITLPVLTLVQNRVDDIYRGRGPAGQYVRLVCNRPTGFNACDWSRTIKVNSQGKWSFANYWDISGNKGMSLRWRRGDDIVSTTNVSPFVQLVIGSPKVSGATRNGASFAVVVKKANTVDVRGSARGIASTATGEFNGKLRNQSGNLVNVRVGDFVTSDVAPDVAWIVHDIPASANSSTGHITGTCHDARSYIVLVYHGGVLVDSDEMYTEMSGNFDIDYLTFQAGDQVQVSCQYESTDWVGKWITAS